MRGVDWLTSEEQVWDSDYGSVKRVDFGVMSCYRGFVISCMEDDWLTDTLSDDEVGLPEGHDLAMDDGEVDLGESMDAMEKEENKWTELGIDALQREGQAPSSSS
ncbi:unnamed protein product [Choristocarpus tenellus]